MEQLVSHLQYLNIIQTLRVADTMLKVNRFYYSENSPYVDAPQRIGYGATISAPHMHAYVLELLNDKLLPGERALDVGSGSGYLTACMAIMIGRNGFVTGIDHIPELVEMSIQNIANGNPDLLESGLVRFVVGDGRLGVPEFGPYNAIHVGAAADELPRTLVDQLKVGGRLIIPVGPSYRYQELVQIDKLQNGSINQQNVIPVKFVPLTNKDDQWP